MKFTGRGLRISIDMQGRLAGILDHQRRRLKIEDLLLSFLFGPGLYPVTTHHLPDHRQQKTEPVRLLGNDDIEQSILQAGLWRYGEIFAAFLPIAVPLKQNPPPKEVYSPH